MRKILNNKKFIKKEISGKFYGKIEFGKKKYQENPVPKREYVRKKK